MSRSDMTLAALAVAIMPDLEVAQSATLAHDPNFDRARIVTTTGEVFIVRAPRNAGAGAGLEVDIRLCPRLQQYVSSGDLPFAVMDIVGHKLIDGIGRVVVSRELPGQFPDLAQFGPGPGLAANIGRAIAALHELPISLFEDLGLPSYEAAEYRDKLLSGLDDAAGTGKVPPVLLNRWERQLENVALWRFKPVVLHGELATEDLLVTGSEVSAMVNWAGAKVGDPAEDLSWLLAAAPDDSLDSILEAYALRRTELVDQNILERAQITSELAVSKWLLYGVRNNDDQIVAEAEAMLTDLAAHL